MLEPDLKICNCVADKERCNNLFLCETLRPLHLCVKKTEKRKKPILR